MLQRFLFSCGVLAAVGLLLSRVPAEPPVPQPRPPYKSPLGLTVDEKGERAYVALHAAGTLAEVDLKAGKVLRTVAVGRGPHSVAVQGDTAWVTCTDDNTLAAVALDTFTVRRRIPVSQEPGDLALVPDSALAYVVCGDAPACRVDLARGRVEPLPDLAGAERVRVGLDGKVLFFLHPRNGRTTPVAVRPSNEVFSADLAALPGAGNARGLAQLTRDGRPLSLIVHQRPRTNLPATQVVQGWVFTNAVSLGLPAGSRSATLDEPTRGCADPTDVATDGQHVFVACAGADKVVVLNPHSLLATFGVSPFDNLRGYGYGGDSLIRYGDENDLTAGRKFVVARLATQTNPRRLALSGDGKTLVVSNHLADSLTVIDAATLKVVRHVPLGGPEPDAVRRGEVLFHSGRMTFQSQFTCASCHPDGGSDGLNWDLTRDGVGNFKNTKSLLGVKDSAPYGWQGTSPTLADRVAGTLRTLHRHEPAGTEVEDLAAYLASLPPPRPLPLGDADRAATARGREVFQGKGRCSDCHYRAALDDGKAHNVGTRADSDTQDAFDTPALRGVARTAPYLHDGRAATLEEIFTKHNPRGWHGAAHTLTKDELADVIVYLRSL